MNQHEFDPEERPLGFAGRIARTFIDSKLTPLLIIAALLLGGLSIMKTPREEECREWNMSIPSVIQA